jgi:polysaccharide deacetylase family protein (PEP-CTERM system associated)
MRNGIPHAFSVDVEDWYHDGGDSTAAGLEHRVERNLDLLLGLLAKHDARATFFFLGEVADQFPPLVRRVQSAGHEIGTHGYHHRSVRDLLRHEFHADVKRSIDVLQELTGNAVLGYRAPYFSIKAGIRWPIEQLASLGLTYDSSVLAIDRPPGLELVCPRVPFRHPNGLWEFPVAVLRMMFFWYLPIASGAGLRMVPRRVLDRSIELFERDVGSGVFYLHPWELDPDSPTSNAWGRWFLRVGRRRLPERLDELMSRIAFAPIRDVFGAQIGSAHAAGAAVNGDAP